MFRLPKKTFLLIALLFDFIGVISVFKYATAPLASRSIGARQDEDVVCASPVDLPVSENPTDRVWELGGWNAVFCYPSVGGIIINRHLTSVELDFFNLSRFEHSPRSSDPNEEDAFCRQLRKTGGKWWISHASYSRTFIYIDVGASAKEREAVVLGWPGNEGVCVLYEKNWGDLDKRGWTWRNACTMEERCTAMENSSAVFYANLEDCEPVRTLLTSFGEHERDSTENYYYDLPTDEYRDL